MTRKRSSCSMLLTRPWPQKNGRPAPWSDTSISTPRTFSTANSLACGDYLTRSARPRYEKGPAAFSEAKRSLCGRTASQKMKGQAACRELELGPSSEAVSSSAHGDTSGGGMPPNASVAAWSHCRTVSRVCSWKSTATTLANRETSPVATDAAECSQPAPDTACAGDGVRPVPSPRAGGDVTVPHRHRIGGVHLVRPPLPPDDDHHERCEPQRQEHSGSGHGEDPDQQERPDHYSARHCARATKRQPLGRIRRAPSPRPDSTPLATLLRSDNDTQATERGLVASIRRTRYSHRRLVGDIGAAFSAAKRSLCGRFASQNVRGP